MCKRLSFSQAEKVHFLHEEIADGCLQATQGQVKAKLIWRCGRGTFAIILQNPPCTYSWLAPQTMKGCKLIEILNNYSSKTTDQNMFQCLVPEAACTACTEKWPQKLPWTHTGYETHTMCNHHQYLRQHLHVSNLYRSVLDSSDPLEGCVMYKCLKCK